MIRTRGGVRSALALVGLILGGCSVGVGGDAETGNEAACDAGVEAIQAVLQGVETAEASALAANLQRLAEEAETYEIADATGGLAGTLEEQRLDVIVFMVEPYDEVCRDPAGDAVRSLNFKVDPDDAAEVCSVVQDVIDAFNVADRGQVSLRSRAAASTAELAGLSELADRLRYFAFVVEEGTTADQADRGVEALSRSVEICEELEEPVEVSAS